MISRSLWLFHDSSLFISPVTSIHPGEHGNRHCEREFTWRGTWEDGSTFLNFSEKEKFLVLSGVWTLATCLAGECFTHYTMPLGPCQTYMEFGSSRDGKRACQPIYVNVHLKSFWWKWISVKWIYNHFNILVLKTLLLLGLFFAYICSFFWFLLITLWSGHTCTFSTQWKAVSTCLIEMMEPPQVLSFTKMLKIATMKGKGSVNESWNKRQRMKI